MLNRLTASGFLLAGLLAPTRAIRADDHILTEVSPGGATTFSLAQTEDGPRFTVSFRGQTVLIDSPIGLHLTDETRLGPGLDVIDRAAREIDETWTPVWGTDSPIRDHCREIRFPLRGEDRALDLLVRVYDDGVAFRYAIPGDGQEIQINDELTAFCFPEDVKTFAMPLEGFGTGYEAPYQTRPLSQIEGKVIGLPVTVELSNGVWAAITEAHLHDYAGMYVTTENPDTTEGASSSPHTLYTRLSRRGGKPAVVRNAPFETPWRVILLGDHPGRLIESNMVVNCNPPCAIDDTSWIKPGKVIWDWWCRQMVSGVDFAGGMNTETLLHFADFAAEQGFEYLLIDEGWSWWENIETEQGKTVRVTDITRAVPAVDLPKILEFCHRRGVKVWLWLTWSHCAAQMEEAFPLYEKWGVAGVKVDFMNRDDQWMVNWYHEVAEKAARHHLLVDMHGAYKNDGIRRTWPNMLTREGVMGLEHSKWSSNVTPDHNVTVPFTRMLAGPMDYTPGGFNVSTVERFRHRDDAPYVMGTMCHQLAQYVIYESPLQMCVDYPDNYRGKVGLEFLRWVPTTWDRSIVIDGYPGRFITMARRNGDAWYVGAMTGNEKRSVEVPLDFLGGGRYRLELFADGPRADKVPEQVTRATRYVTSADTITIEMAPGGGYAARLLPDSVSQLEVRRVRHLVAFSFKPATTDPQREEFLAAADRLPERIPVIIGYERGPNLATGRRGQRYDHGILFTFRTRHDLDTYLAHPEHRAFTENYVPWVEDFAVIDWSVMED